VIDLRSVEADSAYTHIFAYKVSRENHRALLGVLARISKVLKKHGMASSRIYQLGKTNVFKGFEGFEKALGSFSAEEIWIETDFYSSKAEFDRIMAKLTEDKEAQLSFGELRQITASRPVIMGEFHLLATE